MTHTLRYSILTSALAVLIPAANAQELGPWSSPINLGATVNSTCNDQHPALSKDGLSLIFASNRPYTPGPGCLPALHLWVSQRDSLDSAFEAPQPLTALNADNNAYEDNAPNLTTDGHWMFFHSQRPSDCVPAGGIFQLWAAHRKNKRDDFGWEAPINLGCLLNGPTDNAGPTFFDDNGTLYLYFTRNLLLPAADPAGLGIDIYVSTCSASLTDCNRQQLWEPAVFVPEFNSARRDTRTAIRRRDGLEMFITSNRLGSENLSLDLWVSTRFSAAEPWSIPVSVDEDNVAKGGAADLNTNSNDGGPALSWNGQTLLFYSNRPGTLGLNDLYVSVRQKLTGGQ